jgi:hypothetical protein
MTGLSLPTYSADRGRKIPQKIYRNLLIFGGFSDTANSSPEHPYYPMGTTSTYTVPSKNDEIGRFFRKNRNFSKSCRVDFTAKKRSKKTEKWGKMDLKIGALLVDTKVDLDLKK